MVRQTKATQICYNVKSKNSSGLAWEYQAAEALNDCKIDFKDNVNELLQFCIVNKADSLLEFVIAEFKKSNKDNEIDAEEVFSKHCLDAIDTKNQSLIRKMLSHITKPDNRFLKRAIATQNVKTIQKVIDFADLPLSITKDELFECYYDHFQRNQEINLDAAKHHEKKCTKILKKLEQEQIENKEDLQKELVFRQGKIKKLSEKEDLGNIDFFVELASQTDITISTDKITPQKEDNAQIAKLREIFIRKMRMDKAPRQVVTKTRTGKDRSIQQPKIMPAFSEEEVEKEEVTVEQAVIEEVVPEEVVVKIPKKESLAQKFLSYMGRKAETTSVKKPDQTISPTTTRRVAIDDNEKSL
jgi:hypothetical protein